MHQAAATEATGVAEDGERADRIAARSGHEPPRRRLECGDRPARRAVADPLRRAAIRRRLSGRSRASRGRRLGRHVESRDTVDVARGGRGRGSGRAGADSAADRSSAADRAGLVAAHGGRCREGAAGGVGGCGQDDNRADGCRCDGAGSARSDRPRQSPARRGAVPHQRGEPAVLLGAAHGARGAGRRPRRQLLRAMRRLAAPRPVSGQSIRPTMVRSSCAK